MIYCNISDCSFSSFDQFNNNPSAQIFLNRLSTLFTRIYSSICSIRSFRIAHPKYFRPYFVDLLGMYCTNLHCLVKVLTVHQSLSIYQEHYFATVIYEKFRSHRMGARWSSRSLVARVPIKCRKRLRKLYYEIEGPSGKVLKFQ